MDIFQDDFNMLGGDYKRLMDEKKRSALVEEQIKMTGLWKEEMRKQEEYRKLHKSEICEQQEYRKFYKSEIYEQQKYREEQKREAKKSMRLLIISVVIAFVSLIVAIVGLFK